MPPVRARSIAIWKAVWACGAAPVRAWSAAIWRAVRVWRAASAWARSGGRPKAAARSTARHRGASVEAWLWLPDVGVWYSAEHTTRHVALAFTPKLPSGAKAAAGRATRAHAATMATSCKGSCVALAATLASAIAAIASYSALATEVGTCASDYIDGALLAGALVCANLVAHAVALLQRAPGDAVAVHEHVWSPIALANETEALGAVIKFHHPEPGAWARAAFGRAHRGPRASDAAHVEAGLAAPAAPAAPAALGSLAAPAALAAAATDPTGIGLPSSPANVPRLGQAVSVAHVEGNGVALPRQVVGAAAAVHEQV